jgi:DNA-binding NtrC family response regulator
VARQKVLLVDDEADIRFVIGTFLRSQGYDVVEAESCRGAEAVFQASRPDLAILDYQLPDGTALDLLPRLKEIDSATPLLILTAHGTIPMAVHAIKEGAEQFLTKPIELPALAIILRRSLDAQRDRRKQMAGSSRRAREAVDPFLGTSDAIRQLERRAHRVLVSESPILIQGETGTGKTLLAKWLHEQGPRADETMVDLNCAALSRELLETELFGYEKGAFTGAAGAKMGLLEVAHRGTVFLDEIGDMDVQVQPKLLKVIEEKQFRRVGGVRDRHVDIRLVAASHQDLEQLVEERRFRGDLLFRINTIPLQVPSLRERSEDILLLAERILKNLAGEIGCGEVSLSASAEAALTAYAWPGNIRELRNVLERALLLSESNVLTAEDFRFSRAARPDDATIADNERRHIEQVLREEGGRVDRAAGRLGIVRSALYKKIKKHGIVIPR